MTSGCTCGRFPGTAKKLATLKCDMGGSPMLYSATATGAAQKITKELLAHHLGEGILPAAHLNIENWISFSVMNSSSAGVPSCVFRTARLMAGMISAGSLTRSP